MYVLFEIADRDLIIIGIIFVLICLIAFFLFRMQVNKHRPKPLDDNERYDTEEVSKEDMPKELTEEQIKAKEELERVYNQMNADLQAAEPSREEIDDFEREQEENAIISYKELMRQAEKLKAEATREEAKDSVSSQLRIEYVLDDEVYDNPVFDISEIETILEAQSAISNAKITLTHKGCTKNYKHNNVYNYFVANLKDNPLVDIINIKKTLQQPCIRKKQERLDDIVIDMVFTFTNTTNEITQI